MAQTTVRIAESTRSVLRELARDERTTMRVVLEKSVEEYRRKRFLDDVNRAYSELRSDPRAWATYEDEIAAWETTLRDGLPEAQAAPGRVRQLRRNARPK